MTGYLALPSAREVRGTVAAPPSKSATNRALVLAALSEKPVELVPPLDSEDTRALERCLAAMGAVFEPTDSGLSVHGPLGRSGKEEVILDAAASGTAARFLVGVAAAVPGRWLVTGSPRLLERPIEELVAALRSAGAELEHVGRRGFLPLSIRGGTLSGGTVSVDASRSSQFFSALLLTGVAVKGGFAVRPVGTVASAPYIETTVQALEDFGHAVRRGRDGAIEVARGRVAPRRYELPGDWSSAVPFFAAAGIVGGEVSVTGLRWPSPDADALALDVLEGMGISVESGRASIRARGGPRSLAPVSIDAGGFPDAVPALAAVAAFAPGESVFRGIGHLRFKESDRIAALAALLEAAGVSAAAEKHELAVVGPPASSRKGLVRLPTFDDHRIAMAAALLSLGLAGTLVESPDCVAKSYPAFFRDLETILVRG